MSILSSLLEPFPSSQITLTGLSSSNRLSPYSLSEKGRIFILSRDKIKLLGQIDWSSSLRIEWDRSLVSNDTQQPIPILKLFGSYNPDYDVEGSPYFSGYKREPIRTEVASGDVKFPDPSFPPIHAHPLALASILASPPRIHADLPVSAPFPSSGEHALINTHAFDRQLQIVFEPSERVQSMSKEDKLAFLKAFIPLLKYQQSQACVIFIMNSIIAGDTYDRDNKIDTADLILEVLTSRIVAEKENDLLPLIDEQLSDIIVSGSCHTGRTMRFFQLYNIVKDTEAEINEGAKRPKCEANEPVRADLRS